MKYPKRGSYKEAKAIQQKKIVREAKQRVMLQDGMIMHGTVVHGAHEYCEVCNKAIEAFDKAKMRGEI